MNSKTWICKGLSICLMVATTTAYSSITLAASEKIAAELLVVGKTQVSQPLSVKVNGEDAQSGRSIFNSSTIATPANVSAVINAGAAGKIELAPNTVILLSFDKRNIKGELDTGRVTVLSSIESVSVKSANGKVSELNIGESAESAVPVSRQVQTDGNHGSGFLLYAIILGGVATAIVLAATTDNNRIVLGGGATVVSVTR